MLPFLSFLVPLVVLITQCQSQDTLYGVYQRVFEEEPLTIREIDPNTALPGKVLYSNKDLSSLFGGASTVDSNKIWYFAAAFKSNYSVIGLDLNDVNNIKIVLSVSVPWPVAIIEFDELSNQIIVGGSNSPFIHENSEFYPQTTRAMKKSSTKPGFNIFIGIIDKQHQTFKILTKLPDDHYFFTISGSASALDIKSRSLVISTQIAVQNPVTFWVDVVDISKGTVVSFQQNTYFGQGMIYINDKFFTLMGKEGSPISVGYFDTVTGQLKPEIQWAQASLTFVVSGITIASYVNNTVYSIVGNGAGVPVGLASVDATTGDLKNYILFPGTGNDYNQPQFITIC